MELDILDKLIERAEKAMGKKLTTKDRKKMKKSTFCGKNRSFPVSDCKHVAIAKAYLGRSKFSKEEKKKIAACINRRAKVLKCNVSKKAKAYTKYEYNMFTDEQKDLYNSGVFASTRDLVNLSIKKQ